VTDSRLQQLERAWEASGSVKDEVAYLRERVRVGGLSEERFGLLLRSKQELAPGLSESEVVLAIRSLLGDAERFGGYAAVLAAVTKVVEAALVLLGSEREFGRSIVSALRNCRDCPCEAHARALMSTTPLGSRGMHPLLSLAPSLGAWFLPAYEEFTAQSSFAAQSMNVVEGSDLLEGRSPRDVLEVVKEGIEEWVHSN